MKTPATREPILTSPTRWAGSVAGLVIAGAALAAYHNSLSGPFLFDDVASIRDNPTIRHLWPLTGPLSPPLGNAATVTGRPVLNLSLAVNYAFGGLNVRGYHAANLAIHILAALTLFGVVRRTIARWSASAPMRLATPSAGKRIGADALHPVFIAFVVALIWAVHPLQTEAVTYVVQRAESLMGLFYLLTFYGFIRYSEAAGGRIWAWFSVVCCLLGMATKEVAVSAPVLVLLYDRTFVSGTFREAWQRRWSFYFALAGTWLVLVAEMAITGGNRGGSVGFGSGTTWWAYALTQFPAITTYLRLSIWPHPLVFDYGTAWVRGFGEILPEALVVLVLGGGTVWALGRPRWAAIGFLGAWFFAILAPTSLVPGTTQMVVEHRMYLPLAALITLGVLAGEGIRASLFPRLGWRGGIVVYAAVAAAGAALTIHRNENYRSALALWGDTAAKRPENVRALSNLGIFLQNDGRPQQAISADEAALRLKPDFALAENNLGNALVDAGRVDDAIPHYQRALQLKPDFALAEDNLGVALVRAGRIPEALPHYQAALRLAPDYAEGHFHLGNAYGRLHRLTEAVAQYDEALRLEPGHAQAHCNLGSALMELGQLDAAIAQYGAACRLDPNLAQAREYLEIARQRAGR